MVIWVVAYNTGICAKPHTKWYGKRCDQGEALIGVNVTGKGTTIGTVTDIDGKYYIRTSKRCNSISFLLRWIHKYGENNFILNCNKCYNVLQMLALVEEVVVTASGNQKRKKKYFVWK
jgi:hypothetical protein